MNSVIRRASAGLGIFIGFVILAAVVFFSVLTIAEYRPAEIENIEIQLHTGGSHSAPAFNPPTHPSVGVPFNLLSWNIGYASLDASQDFFMDGGKGIRPATNENVRRNLAVICETIEGSGACVALIQEVDIDSKRSYNVDEKAYLTATLAGPSVFAYNYNSIFVPIPFPEFIGKVKSGLLTMSRYDINEAQRLNLPNPFSWPTRVANLKRCLLVSRIPVENSGAELVMVNLHLEAYDSSGGREAQTKALLDFLHTEYAKGNYCIAGGDFNQNFPGIDPVRFAVKNSDFFVPGTLSHSLLAAGWQYAADSKTPSCRLLNEPFSGNLGETQLYVIDGFILSPNVELISVETIYLGFKHSDHNPVRMKVSLK